MQRRRQSEVPAQIHQMPDRLQQGELPGSAENTTQLIMLFALNNLWLARSTLLQRAKTGGRLQCNKLLYGRLKKLQI